MSWSFFRSTNRRYSVLRRYFQQRNNNNNVCTPSARHRHTAGKTTTPFIHLCVRCSYFMAACFFFDERTDHAVMIISHQGVRSHRARQPCTIPLHPAAVVATAAKIIAISICEAVDTSISFPPSRINDDVTVPSFSFSFFLPPKSCKIEDLLFEKNYRIRMLHIASYQFCSTITRSFFGFFSRTAIINRM